MVNDVSNFAVESFGQTLEQYGADLAAVRYFDTGGFDLLPYATLLARKAHDPVLAALTGVYEWQSTPLVFLVDGEKLAPDPALNHIRRLVAMRGDAPYLGVVRPGKLTLYRVSLDGDPPASARIPLLNIPAGEERATFPHLGNERPGTAFQSRKWISKVVLTLLSTSIEELKTRFNVPDNDAISLVGRALFTRFLAEIGRAHV